MKCLIDADILRYEIGWSGQYKNEKGEEITREWEFVEELFDHKIGVILNECDSEEKPTLYLTSDATTIEIYNRWLKTHGTPHSIKLIPNFRNAIATVKPYKSTRKSVKPDHYANITAYIMENYHFVLANGQEADDRMAIDQSENTIICSRDKDLRQVPGWHYSWECGKQRSIGPFEFSKKGWVEEKITYSPTQKKADGTPVAIKGVFGGGELMFIYQLLVGDPVDTIPGCPKVGHVVAMKLLEENKSRKDLYEAVRACYRGIFGEDDIKHLEEQGKLLWLLRSFNDEWEYPYK